MYPQPATPDLTSTGRAFVMSGGDPLTTILITATSDRATIAAAIGELKARHDRLPAHFADHRAEVMAEIEHLVDMWRQAPETDGQGQVQQR